MNSSEASTCPQISRIGNGDLWREIILLCKHLCHSERALKQFGFPWKKILSDELTEAITPSVKNR
jgi:hypothetical protein